MEHGNGDGDGYFYNSELFMFRRICKFSFMTFIYLKIFYCHENVHNNCVYICDVYVQDMLIAGIGTFNYNITIIFL